MCSFLEVKLRLLRDPKKKPDVGKYDMRDKRQHTLYLQIVPMKKTGPAPQY